MSSPVNSEINIDALDYELPPVASTRTAPDSQVNLVRALQITLTVSNYYYLLGNEWRD